MIVTLRTGEAGITPHLDIIGLIVGHQNDLLHCPELQVIKWMEAGRYAIRISDIQGMTLR